jgi:hypothetical protein
VLSCGVPDTSADNQPHRRKTCEGRLSCFFFFIKRATPAIRKKKKTEEALSYFAQTHTIENSDSGFTIRRTISGKAASNTADKEEEKREKKRK